MPWAQLKQRKELWVPYLGVDTHSRASEKVGELSCSPMQNGLLNTLHIEE